ncbi:hypothetical protein FSP39_011743 [Pinctada imbricata]|uniref:DNA-repair protein Xrcc1 N-terminal domain-containing protein n=1 Tax=Pinctada imbricata TaxID=66713 RepID=A0AA89BJ86_PINIB|nr:hypothetical protein FSP39_011743 [Pinctada imbricata]
MFVRLQDEVHKVNNLIRSDGTKKWLTHSKDRSGQAEAVFQLEGPSVISYIDIGSIWSAMVEIQVGCSDWPQDKPYQTLLPTCSLMTPADCRLGQNFIKTRMFGTNDFSEENAFKEWDRLKIILRQPFKREAQFGLSFLHLKSTIKTPSSVSKTQSGKSVKAIQKHFFGKSANSSSKEDQLKTKLLKIAGSSENGSEHEESLTRTAKLVLAGSTSGNKMTGKKQEVDGQKPALYYSHMAQKYGPQFDEEVQEFLKTLTLVEEELDRITMADLRHRFERKKKRKLTLEEKKTFVKLARDHLNSIFGEEGGEEISSKSKHINLKTDQNSGKPVLQNNDEKSSNKTDRDMTSVCEKTNAKPENNVPGKSPLSFKKSTPLAQVKHGDHRANSPGSSPKPFMEKLVKNLGFSPTVKKPSAKSTENLGKGEKNCVKTPQKIGSKEVFSTSYEVLGCDDGNNEVEIQNTDNLWLNCNSSPVTPKSVGRGRGGRGRGRRRGSQTKEGGNSGQKRGKPLSGVNDLEEDTVVKKRKVSGRGRRGRGRYVWVVQCLC